MHFLGHAERDGRITAIQLDEIERAGPNLTPPKDQWTTSSPRVSITTQQHDIDNSATRPDS